MKRFLAASVAAATSLTLVTMPAQAAETKKSSEVTQGELDRYVTEAARKERANKGDGFSAPFKTSVDNKSITADITSSVANDAVHGYKVGTTYDVLVGFGIATSILALVAGAAALVSMQGMIPEFPF